MKIEFAEKSKIQVIDSTSKFYRFRGTVSKLPERDPENHQFVSDEVICHLHDLDGNDIGRQNLRFSQIKNIQKKFIDIEHIRENDVDLGNGIIRKGNVGAFEVGDIISIQEKHDGANASICYNPYDYKLEVFSRTNLLDGVDGLRGFKSYVETKVDPKLFVKDSRYVVFGEWCVKHTCKYAEGWENHWRVYDVWDKETDNYMTQAFVKTFCELHGLEYVGELYHGPFVSWEHCRSFMKLNSYGPQQEGVVVKNQSKLTYDVRMPKYLKIVNEEFSECMHSTKRKAPKVIDPEVKKAQDEAKSLVKSIVTEARVKKMICKFIDEGLLEAELKPADMGKVAKLLPKAIFEDVMKEEKETMAKVGELAGKLVASIAIGHAKTIVLGSGSK